MPRLDPKILTSLAILLLVLPDPDQELSIQTIHKFHLFPKLPPELRAMIWVHTFPPGRQFRYFGDIISMRILETNNSIKPKFVSPPVAHRITQESRSETLKHYSHTARTIMSSHDARLNGCKRSFLFNCDRDTLMAPLIQVLRSRTWHIGIDNHINYFELHHELKPTLLSTFLPRLRTLDLVQLFSKERQITSFDIHHTSILRYCSGLETIRVAGLARKPPVEGPIKAGALAAMELKSRAEVILRYFEKRNAEDPAFRIPKITLHHVYAFENYGEEYIHRRHRIPYPMGDLIVPPTNLNPS
jgi:hypothetical protein